MPCARVVRSVPPEDGSRISKEKSQSCQSVATADSGAKPAPPTVTDERAFISVPFSIQ